MKTTNKCPFCGEESKQVNNGHNRSGTQRVLCRHCGKTYTHEAKKREYPPETVKEAIKMYYSGVSGRGVANCFGFNKSNVVRWLKKLNRKESNFQILELDELYHFTNKRPRTGTRENAYVMTMVSRFPRQIAGFDVAADKCSWRIQRMVDGASWAKT